MALFTFSGGGSLSDSVSFFFFPHFLFFFVFFFFFNFNFIMSFLDLRIAQIFSPKNYATVLTSMPFFFFCYLLVRTILAVGTFTAQIQLNSGHKQSSLCNGVSKFEMHYCS